MATVLRVKRRNADEPLNSLIIACKKQKTNDNQLPNTSDSVDLTALVKFAGTVQNQGDAVEQIKKTLTKKELEANYKQHNSDVVTRNRLQTRENSKQKRYKVINCFRSRGTSIEELDEEGMTVIDVEDSVSCSVIDPKDKDSDYVYDLYYAKTEAEITADDLFEICERPEIFEFRENIDNHSDSYDSEDSNSESNWRNDYPDSDEHSDNSIDEEDIRQAVERCKIYSDESDLSDDDDDSQFVYTVDEADVDNFGYRYAKFKAGYLRNNDSASDGSDHSGVHISEVTSDEEDIHDTDNCHSSTNDDDDSNDN